MTKEGEKKSMRRILTLIVVFLLLMSFSTVAFAANFSFDGLASSDPLWSNQSVVRGKDNTSCYVSVGRVYQKNAPTSYSNFYARMYYGSTQAMNDVLFLASGGEDDGPLKSPYNDSSYADKSFRMKFSHNHSYRVVAEDGYFDCIYTY